jgi:hypothetical protein
MKIGRKKAQNAQNIILSILRTFAQLLEAYANLAFDRDASWHSRHKTVRPTFGWNGT